MLGDKEVMKSYYSTEEVGAELKPSLHKKDAGAEGPSTKIKHKKETCRKVKLGQIAEDKYK